MIARYLPADLAETQQDKFALAAVAAGIAGLLAIVPFGAAPQALLLTLFVVAGPGSAIVSWIDLPAGAAVAAAIGVSLAVIIAVTTVQLWLRIWAPNVTCLVMAVAVVLVGLARIRQSRLQLQDGVT